ncbi:MAG: DPP IV N-terminal domain-containing protein [Planctomycetes bacterium]|nr:DPP IV N-terminal domain-containing protein [Planctomycetota bacterium]
MKRLTLVVLSAVSVLLLTSTTADAQRRVRRSSGARWAHDGVHLILDDTWYEPLAWTSVTPVPTLSTEEDGRELAFRQAMEQASGRSIPNTVWNGQRSRGTLPRAAIEHPGHHASSDGSFHAVVLDGALWAAPAGETPKQVKDGLAGVRHFELAPDGSAASYIHEYDLHVTRTDDGTTHRLTQDGSENVFNGELDWVYQEEVYGRGNFDATWWSPTSEHLAFLKILEEGVDTFTVVDHIPNQLTLEYLKYPKAGTTNPRIAMFVANAKTGDLAHVDLSKYTAEQEILIIRVDWTPQGEACTFQVQDREQTWLDLNVVDPKTGAVRTVLHEECKDGWVNRLEPPRFLKDGTFLWESERTGWKHLYRYDLDGKLVATVTHGEWEVRNVLRVDEERGFVAVSGTTPTYAIGTNAYVATLDGQSLQQCTRERGSHTVSFNGDGTLLLDQWSHLENPGEQWLRKADGTPVRMLQKDDLPEDAHVTKWEQIQARDGEWLDVTYLLPNGFDPAKSYPVWIETYSGPDAATVRDVWRGTGGPDDYVLLQVNVRSASGRGMKYTKQCYGQFGVQELKDIEDAIDWLTKNPWADGTRVGITGWSYGGFMTAFALTHSKKFKCGIAGAGVYDWELYDTIYTERYMKKPQNNRAGYASSSVVKAARNLHGQLLIVHGTMDDNVHMQNAIQFIDALQKAGKMNFEFMLYPKSRHGVRSQHLGKLRQEFMKKYL